MNWTVSKYIGGNVGLTTFNKGYVAYNFSQTVELLENAGWIDVSETTINADDSRNFDIFIPLRIIFGFAEDYQKIIINAKHELVLLRSGNDLNAVIRTYAENNVLEGFKINLKKVEWLMPYVQLTNEYKIPFYRRRLEKNKSISVSYRTWEMYEYSSLPISTSHVWTVNDIDSTWKTSLHNNRLSNES